MKRSFTHGKEACIVSILYSAVCHSEVVCHLSWCSRFCSDVLELKSLEGPAPISGGNPSQDYQMQSQHSTSLSLSCILPHVFGRFVLAPILGCHGQILGHWKMQLEWFCQDRNKTQKLHNGHGSIHCSIILKSLYSLPAANTASVRPSFPSSPAAMDAVP